MSSSLYVFTWPLKIPLNIMVISHFSFPIMWRHCTSLVNKFSSKKHFDLKYKTFCFRDFSGGPVSKTPCSQYRGPGSIPGQGTGSHMPQQDQVWWIRKLWYIYTMEYYSAIKKNSFESVLMRWLKLEPIIQSEVSQKDKDQYSILMHVYGI